jgi:ubiquinone/menaquinone biosynthesis C-methylase UbiE
MYIDDEKIIEHSNRHRKFRRFVITSRNVRKQLEECKSAKIFMFQHNLPSKFMIVFAWLLILVAVLLSGRLPTTILLSLVVAGASLFGLDFLNHRAGGFSKYVDDLSLLQSLLGKRELSEYDIAAFRTDDESKFPEYFENQRAGVNAKARIVRCFVQRYGLGKKRILHIGCGGALHAGVSQPYFENGCELVGLDVYIKYLKEFRALFNAYAIEANAMSLPLPSQEFDAVNFTDILEHLHAPELGLLEASRVLKTGGLMLLSTDSRCYLALNIRQMNPLIFCEKLIGQYFTSILPPPNIIGRWTDFNFYHTEFSKAELTALLRGAGFRILHFESGFHTGNLGIARKRMIALLRQIPVLQDFCGEFLLVAMKVS